MTVDWTEALIALLKQHKIHVDNGNFDIPKVHTYRNRPHEPNASLEHLVAEINKAIDGSSVRPSNVAVQTMYHRVTGDRHDSAKYQTGNRTREAAAKPAVQPARKRTREDDRADARVKRAAFENTAYGFKISAWTDEEREVVRQWRNVHPHDTSKSDSPSADLVELGKTMKRTPDAIYRRLPAAQTEGESACAAVRPAPQQQEPAASTCSEYPKSGTPVSKADRMLVTTWARNNPSDLAGKGSMSPAFMELVRAMQRPPKGISYMVTEYHRNNRLAAPEAPAASETRATTGGKQLPRARSQSPVPSWGSSSSSSEDEQDERPTTGGKTLSLVEDKRLEYEQVRLKRLDEEVEDEAEEERSNDRFVSR